MYPGSTVRVTRVDLQEGLESLGVQVAAILFNYLRSPFSSWNSPNITHLTFTVSIGACLIKNARRAAGREEKNDK